MTFYLWPTSFASRKNPLSSTCFYSLFILYFNEWFTIHFVSSPFACQLIFPNLAPMLTLMFTRFFFFAKIVMTTTWTLEAAVSFDSLLKHRRKHSCSRASDFTSLPDIFRNLIYSHQLQKIFWYLGNDFTLNTCSAKPSSALLFACFRLHFLARHLPQSDLLSSIAKNFLASRK